MMRPARRLVSSSVSSPLATAAPPLAKTAPETPIGQPWKSPQELASPHIGSSNEFSVSFAYPSKSSNAPRLLDASHFKKVIPFQKTAWSPTIDDAQIDGIAERPQSQLAVHFKRDEVEPLPLALVEDDYDRRRRKQKESWVGALWRKAKRVGQGKYTQEGLMVRDETYWKWWVEDGFGFRGKPRHLKWEQFAEELESMSLHWEPHPKKPEDYLLLHLVRSDPKSGEKHVVWSAEHAAWQGPVMMDLYAAVGTMLARRLKTRTLSFDNGRGTTTELNIRHVSPWTTAVQVNARPPYFYDPYLREQREENASWYFTKELIAHPGVDEAGTVSFYISAEALGYHVCQAMKSLLDRPLWMFYSRGRRRAARHHAAGLTEGQRLANVVRQWTGHEDTTLHEWPQPCALDAITENWLEDAPFPVTTVHSRVRKLCKLKPENLERRHWVDTNKMLTQDVARSVVSAHAPALLLPGSDGEPSFLQRLLQPDEPQLRSAVYKRLTSEQVQELLLLRESDDAFDREQQELQQRSAEEAGRQKAATLKAESGDSQEDSESWEWYLREEQNPRKKEPEPETGTGAVSL